MVSKKKNLTAQSREIVIKSSYDKIDGMTYDISELLGKYFEKPVKSIEWRELPEKTASNGKIIIEIDSEVLENSVFNVLKSEKGREIIRSTMNRKQEQK